MTDTMKQVIVMRNDLNMRKGKMVAQGAHASMKSVLEHMDHPWVKEWLAGSFAKIVVRVDSLDELRKIHRKALSLDVPTAWITDAGRTEFGGVPTDTCISVGPAPVKLVDEITGNLRLL